VSAPRGGSEQTKAEILAAAQKLFAEHGILAVSVRDVAKEAGVTHGLIHHYFGTKEQLAAQVIRSALSASAHVLAENPLDADPGSLDVMRRMLRHFLTDGRMSAVLLARAELTGFEPAKLQMPDVMNSLKIVSERFASIQSQTTAHGYRPDPVLLALFVGAGLFGLITMHNWLTAAVGLRPEDLDARIDEIIEMIVAFVGQATGLIPTES
jgi:AcrR family transcriptional regulator